MEFLVCDKPEQIRQVQALRFEVYCVEKGWVEAEECPNGLEVDEQDDLAVHFLALDEGKPIGTSRLLLGSKQPLPAAEYIDLSALGLPIDKVAEVSRLATVRLSRSQDLLVFFGLTKLMWEWGMERSMLAWLAIADLPLFSLLKRLGMPILAVAPETYYMGSACVPVAFDVPNTGAALQRSSEANDVDGGALPGSEPVLPH